MRALVFGSVMAMCLALPPMLPQSAAAQDLIPDGRFVLGENTDIPGGDIASIFDTNLDACERACLTNDACEAITFNTRNGSCFLKDSASEGTYFEGAYSGVVLETTPAYFDLATARAAQLDFVQEWEFSSAFDQASNLANTHINNAFTAEEHLASAQQSELQGDVVSASRFTGAALNITDLPETWAEYARLLLASASQDANNQSSYREQAFYAAINAYLRADNTPLQHNILLTMGQALEDNGRGREKVFALRLAQALQPRDDTAAALDDAVAKYGFRIVENVVEADSARPRICVNFSEELVKSGVDYATFVQLPDPAQSVSFDGAYQLCIEGVTRGTRQTITFRQGLPAGDGQTLTKSVDITAYVRDRSPGVRFPGRGYVLPRGETAAIPVDTVNTTKLKLALFQVTDRNLLRTLQEGYFGRPMEDYLEYDFQDHVGKQIWTGEATVGQEVNRDITTRLPMAEAIAGQAPGVYALRASVPGVDPYAVPAAWQWFVVSDLGLTTLSGVDGLHVFVRSLGTAGAKAGVSVDLISRTNEVLATVATDANGYAHFEPGLSLGLGGMSPALIVAHEGDSDIAFLSLIDPEFDLSDRGVEGREAAPPVDVFLTTDRGAYRAGETVFATALARDPKAEAIAGLPLTAVLTRPDGVEYSRSLAPDAGAGGHIFTLPIAGSAPRGVWRLEVYADADAPALTSKTFLVEDFLPERIDFALKLGDGPIHLGDSPSLTVDAKYLFGAPGADLAIEGEVLLLAATQIKAWPGYSFGRHDAPFDAVIESFGGTKTDAAGQATLDLALPDVADPGRPLQMRVTARVAEGSGRPVERRIDTLLAPSSAIIGIKPMFDDVVAENTEARFDLIAVDPSLAATPMAVHWQINRLEANYQWYQKDGSWNWEPVYTRSPVAEGDSTLGITPTEIAAPVKWGQYELTVSRDDGETAVSSVQFYAGWYAPADVSATPDTLELSLDKPAYKSGDTATLRIVPRAAGTALISVLSNRLVMMKAVEVVEGENTISLDVTDDWGAGVYVTASVLRPMDVAAGRNPARALGLTHAKIDPGLRALTANIDVATEASPRGPLDIAVKVDGITAGDTAYVTIAAVDLGILNLTGFKAPDPQDHYFGQRKLGVAIRDIYGRLIDGLNGAEGSVRSGGDAGAQARLQSPPPTEELVAYFTGPVQVGADGIVRTSFDLPAFNGTVKIMAVAWSNKGVGQATADVLVRDPVVVTASLPRFLAPGDQTRLLLEIVHATGPSGRMGLDITSAGLTLGDAPSGVDLTNLGKAVIAVPVTAPTGSHGIQTIEVTLTTVDGKVLRKTLTVPVQTNDPAVIRISRFDLKKGQEFTFDQAAFSGLIAGSGKATLAVGPIARMNAPGILAALDRYPYGCTEQMTSKAMPLLYFDDVAIALGLPGSDNIKTRVDQAIAEILTNQSSNGAFGLWGPSSGDMWLDAFVTDFLSRAKSRGFTVPDAAFRTALDNLRNQVNYQPDFDKGGEALAYALMVLAREGAAAIGDLRYFVDVKGDAFATPTAMAQLGSALASYGDQPRADAMFRRAAVALSAQTGPDQEQIYRADFGTNFRDLAAVLALAAEANTQTVDREALITQLTTTRSLSTQEAAWTLLAANALIDQAATGGITLNGTPSTGPLIKVLDATNAAPLVVGNTGDDTTLTVTTYGVPSVPEPAGGAGYAITRSYYTLDGEPTTLDGIKTGQRLIAVLDVTPFGRGEARLMVSDPLPAGFEIDNPNLLSSGSLPALDALNFESDVTHTEFRQDRFLAALDRHSNAAFRLGYIVRAISPGTFHQPAASVEDMYRPDLTGRSDAATVQIAE